ncbi:MAG: hypothetical protein FJY92_12225 [Candidatus Hydrogenedentes bacterium]|nr:hypothetical protein [Candidatus Hydrogenedentota bacterium]
MLRDTGFWILDFGFWIGRRGGWYRADSVCPRVVRIGTVGDVSNHRNRGDIRGNTCPGEEKRRCLAALQGASRGPSTSARARGALWSAAR